MLCAKMGNLSWEFACIRSVPAYFLLTIPSGSIKGLKWWKKKDLTICPTPNVLYILIAVGSRQVLPNATARLGREPPSGREKRRCPGCCRGDGIQKLAAVRFMEDYHDHHGSKS
jgi:hypothetical protein